MAIKAPYEVGWVFFGITQCKTDTLTVQKLYHLCNNGKCIQQASCKGSLINLGQGEVVTARGWVWNVLQAHKAEHVPWPYPDAIPG